MITSHFKSNMEQSTPEGARHNNSASEKK